MQYVYEDLGITIALGPGPNTADDLVSFTLSGTDEPVAITNSLVHQPAGIRACMCSLGLKADGKPDFTVITLPQPGHTAAVFSRSRCPGYAVLRNRAVMAESALQALAVNSGNGNVFTPNGMQDLTRMAELLAQEFGVDAERILISQTGAVGVPLPMEVFEAGIPQLSTTLRTHNLDAASEAILTTDIGPKVASVALGDMVLAGIAKGAGMVEPNMATMLAYFFTNAQLDAAVLHEALTEAVDLSFNRISIDGETSMDDTVALLSTGALAVQEEQKIHFRQALIAMSVKLARDIVSQGEGVTKTMEVTVDSDVSVEHAQRLAKNICNSPLVKTAVHGGKPGWGRMVAAIGKPAAGYTDPMLAPDHVEISLQGQPVYRRGQVVSPDTQALHAALHTEKVIHVHVTLGAGGCLGRAWGCDLSPEYVQINA